MKSPAMRVWDEIRTTNSLRNRRPKQRNAFERFIRNLWGLFMDGQWGLGDNRND